MATNKFNSSGYVSASDNLSSSRYSVQKLFASWTKIDS